MSYVNLFKGKNMNPVEEEYEKEKVSHFWLIGSS